MTMLTSVVFPAPFGTDEPDDLVAMQLERHAVERVHAFEGA